MCIKGTCAYSMLFMWRSGNIWWKLVFSFHQVDVRDHQAGQQVSSLTQSSCQPILLNVSDLSDVPPLLHNVRLYML